MSSPMTAPGQTTAPDQNDVVILPSGKELVIPRAWPTEKRQGLIGAAIDFEQGQYQNRVADPLGENPVVSGARKTYQDYVAGPLTKGVAGYAKMVAGGLGASPEDAAGVGQSVGETAVPQSMTDAGVMAGAGVAGKLVQPLKRGLQVAGRMAGMTAGGAVGGELSGEGMATGAAKGAGAGLVSEAAGGLGAWGVRSLPAMQKKINKDDTTNFVNWIAEKVPTLRGPKTAEDLQEFVRSGDAKGKLGEMFKTGMAEIKAALPTYAVGGTRHLHVPALGGRVTLEEFQDGLSKLGNAGFGGQKTDWKDRTVVGREARELWAEAIVQGKASLNNLDPTGRAARTLEATHGEYSRGMTVLGMLKGKSAFRTMDDRVDLDLPILQQYAKDKTSLLRDRFGRDDVEDLRHAIRGGAYGKDRPAPGSGRLGEALGDTYLRGKGGATQYIGSLVRGLLPNAGARYNARKPVTLSPGEQTGLDMVGAAGLLPFVPSQSPE